MSDQSQDEQQPVHEPERPTNADVAPGDLDPVVEDGQELGEVAGGGEITDVGGDSPSS